jgi:hypothetical protein
MVWLNLYLGVWLAWKCKNDCVGLSLDCFEVELDGKPNEYWSWRAFYPSSYLSNLVHSSMIGFYLWSKQRYIYSCSFAALAEESFMTWFFILPWFIVENCLLMNWGWVFFFFNIAILLKYNLNFISFVCLIFFLLM